MTVRILYIGGTGRTGSTVLEQILGSLPGVTSVGEMTWFWYAMRAGGRCSCGERYESCPVWSPTLVEAFGANGVDPSRMYRLRLRHDSRHLPLLSIPGARERLLGRLGEYPDNLVRMYEAVAKVTDAKVIVDSSKEPHYSHILASRPELDVRVCHLVRHPIATAWSWSRVRTEHGFGGSHQMQTRGPNSASLYYNVSNAWTERIWNPNDEVSTDSYIRVRYEDFIADPIGVVDRICRFGEIDATASDVLQSDGTAAVASIQTVHSAWGNPNRFGGTKLRLRPDDEWQTSAPRAFCDTVWKRTHRVAGRYGYAWGG